MKHPPSPLQFDNPFDYADACERFEARLHADVEPPEPEDVPLDDAALDRMADGYFQDRADRAYASYFREPAQPATP